MTLHYQILIPLLSLFLVRVDLTDLVPVKIPVKLIKIYDGDSILVSKGNYFFKIRLSKIDAPEMGQPLLFGKKDAGQESKNCLQKLLMGKTHLILSIYGHDMYGRILGDLDGINLRMIENGCASIYPYAVFDSKKEKFDFLKAQMRARQLKKGLWSQGGYMLPKNWRKFSKQTLRRPSHQ
jgi:endonuclease YncB( thermonuclease family)